MKKNSNLTSEQENILFNEATEPPGSSELNNEKREGSYHCANCDTELFKSSTKYESGSGWPSFYKSLPDVFETKTDHYIVMPELSTIVRNVEDIMDIYLMMVHNQQEKDTAITEYA